MNEEHPANAPTVPRHSTLFRTLATCAVLAVLPLLQAWLAVDLVAVSGPDWLAYNLDPEYSYLCNSLLVAEGKPAVVTHHPGVTLDLLGGAVFQVMHRVWGRGDLAPDALGRPEWYLQGMHAYLIFLQALTVFVSGYACARRSRNLAVGLLIQGGWMLCLSNVAALHRVSPEPLALTLALAFAATTVNFAVRADRAKIGAHAIMFGILYGLGVATKITFVPLGIIPLALLPGLRTRALFLGMSGITFTILMGNPLISLTGPEGFFSFQSAAAVQPGVWGNSHAGDSAWPLLANLRIWLPEIWTTERPVVLVAMLSAAALAATWRPGASESVRWKQIALPLGAILAAQAGQVLLASKSAAPFTRYLVPGLGLVGANLALLLLLPRSSRLTVRRMVAAGAVVFVVGLLLRQATAIRGYRRQLGNVAKAGLEAHARQTAEPPEYSRIWYYRASAPPFALWFGNACVGYRFAEALQAQYPDARFYHPLERRFYDFVGEIPRASVLTGRRTMLVQGVPFPGLRADLSAEVIHANPVEHVYRIPATATGL